MSPRPRTNDRATSSPDEPDEHPQDLASLLEHGPPQRRAALALRVTTLLDALGSPLDRPDTSTLVTALAQAMQHPGPEEAWLALSVLTGQFPESSTVQRTVRTARLDGPLEALFAALDQAGLVHEPVLSDGKPGPSDGKPGQSDDAPFSDGTDWPAVEVVTGQVLVDIHHTARNLFNTGIQRVARETARRWARDHGLILVGWTNCYRGYRRLSTDEVDAALNGVDRTSPPVLATTRAVATTRTMASTHTMASNRTVVVPWKCTVLVPELAAEPERAPRYQALANFSCSTMGLIGFDCVPVMAAETSAEGMSVVFARYLATAAHVDRIAAISDAAADEYRGWRTMLVGAGQRGPDIRAIRLPTYAPAPTAAAMHEIRDLIGLGPLPVVLAVGSHEPRKNHLAVLHAAEVLWREGLLFTLVFVGGNSWNSGQFTVQVETLLRANRPVQTILALPDDLLWAAYRLAYCTIFPSLHEGFGLPVAESLASGTPVITSNFGSMREIAGHGGALMVDPRDDRELTEALRRMLLDKSLRNRLAAEAAGLPERSWDDYAEETWRYLASNAPPTSDR